MNKDDLDLQAEKYYLSNITSLILNHNRKMKVDDIANIHNGGSSSPAATATAAAIAAPIAMVSENVTDKMSDSEADISYKETLSSLMKLYLDSRIDFWRNHFNGSTREELNDLAEVVKNKLVVLDEFKDSNMKIQTFLQSVLYCIVEIEQTKNCSLEVYKMPLKRVLSMITIRKNTAALARDKISEQSSIESSSLAASTLALCEAPISSTPKPTGLNGPAGQAASASSLNPVKANAEVNSSSTKTGVVQPISVSLLGNEPLHQAAAITDASPIAASSAITFVANNLDDKTRLDSKTPLDNKTKNDSTASSASNHQNLSLNVSGGASSVIPAQLYSPLHDMMQREASNSRGIPLTGQRSNKKKN